MRVGEAMSDDGATAFCARLRPRLVGALGLHTGDRAVAEELAQEALARAWARWPKVQAMDRPEAWTYRVAFNLARSHWRRKGAERRANQRSATRPPDPPSPDHGSVMAVREAVATLPERQRRAVVCRFFADLSVAETAEALRCAEGTVKALTHKAVAALRDAVEDEIELDEPDEPEESADAEPA